jgi:ribonuclease VapC
MIVDTSAIIAVMREEPEAVAFLEKMENASDALKMSAGNWLEAGIIADSEEAGTASLLLDNIAERLSLQIIAVTFEQAQIARKAYRVFGRGRGHKAKLNYGDCFAYALAVQTGEPLLFKGNDFNHTDVAVA